MPKYGKIEFLENLNSRVMACYSELQAGRNPMLVLNDLTRIEAILSVEYTRNPLAQTVWETGNGKKSRRGKSAKLRENMQRLDFGQRSPEFKERRRRKWIRGC